MRCVPFLSTAIVARLLMAWSAALLVAAAAAAAPPSPASADAARWARHVDAVTIVRDDWGIAHVHGHTDADAVFGAIYARRRTTFRGSKPTT